jgi:hypothetical protein
MSQRRISQLLGAFVLLCLASLAQAREPVLLVLAYVENDKLVKQDLRGDVGLFPLKATKGPQPEWQLRPGESLKGANRPADKFIELIFLVNDTDQTLCVVEVRYFLDGGRWKPYFRIDDSPLVIRDPNSGLWRPAGYVDGNPSLLMFIGPKIPNLEGYYSELDFSLTTGPLAITSYRVR